MSNKELKRLEFQVTVEPDSGAIPLARALKQQLPELSWNQVRDLCSTGKITVDGELVRDARRSVANGVQIVLEPNAPSKPTLSQRAAGPLKILFEDTQIVVIDKPMGISTVPHEAGERTTVLDLVRRTWRQRKSTNPRTALMILHRLDRFTSGVMTLAKTEEARAILTSLFRSRAIEREYFAVVHGEVRRESQRIFSYLANDRGDGRRGSVKPPASGKEAITYVDVVERLEGATLVRCSLETGRTHQIRIHLSEAGHPLLGEKEYLGGDVSSIPCDRLALHAYRLGFRHPRTGRFMRFVAPLPEDMVKLVRQLGGSGRVLEPREREHAPSGRRHQVRDWWQDEGPPSPRAGGRSQRREDGTRGAGTQGGRIEGGWIEGGPDVPRDSRGPVPGAHRREHRNEPGASHRRGESSRPPRRDESARYSRGRDEDSRYPMTDGGGNSRRGASETRFPMQDRDGRSGWRGASQRDVDNARKSNRKRVRPKRADPKAEARAMEKKVEALEAEIDNLVQHAMTGPKGKAGR